MKKRLIICMIILSLCTAFIQAYARIPEDKTSEFLTKAQLNTLSSAYGEYVTRGEFVIMASGLLGIYGIDGVGTLYNYTPFDDVTKGSNEFSAVAAQDKSGGNRQNKEEKTA